VQLKAARAGQSSDLQLLDLAVANAYHALETALQQVKFNRERLLPQAQMAYRLALAGYSSNGGTAFSDLLTAQSSLRGAELSLCRRKTRRAKRMSALLARSAANRIKGQAMCKSIALRIAAFVTLAVACVSGAAHAESAVANGPSPSFSENFVKTALPVQELVADTIPITGKLALDKRQTRIAAARVAGRLGRIFVFEGQSVHAGERWLKFTVPTTSPPKRILLAKRFHDTLAADGTDAELRNDRT